MRPATATNVERHLFEKGGWVSADTLSQFWGITERCLRRRLEGVHIASDKGYKHVFHASQAELLAYADPKWEHGKKELRSVKDLRRNWTARRIPPPYEEDADWPQTETAPVPTPEPMPSVQPELLAP